MKLALYSDLHLEFMRGSPWRPPELDVDLVILAGDIDVGSRGLEWADQTFSAWKRPPVILYVAGNHEYYGSDLNLMSEKLSKPRAGVSFIERATVKIGAVRVLGSTLWADFALLGSDQVARSMATAQRHMNDYQLIRRGNRSLTPNETAKLFAESVEWLDLELSQPWSGQTVVVTHNAPHPDCVEDRFKGGDLSPSFVSDLTWLMEKHPIDIWAYGHTHFNCDFTASACRIISNQKGYPGEAVKGFRPDLTIEIGDTLYI